MMPRPLSLPCGRGITLSRSTGPVVSSHSRAPGTLAAHGSQSSNRDREKLRTGEMREREGWCVDGVVLMKLIDQKLGYGR